MTDAEIGEKALNEMYVFIISGMSAATATLDGKAGIAFAVGIGGVDGVKDILTHPDENHYEAVGRTVGNMIGVVGSLGTGNLVKNATLKTKAATAFGVSESMAEISLGDTFSNLFNTYVANADAFYSKILTDKDYASKVWNGLKENGLDNFVHYFDPDGDGNVSPEDIIDGYKKLFSPPPAFGTAEFHAQYSSTDKSKIIVDTQNHELQKETYKHIVQHDDINKITINTQNYDISKLDNINQKKTIDTIESIDEVSFLLSDILIKTGEKIDLGSYDTHIVKRGDVFSIIAQEHEYSTKDLVKLNPWIFDENRIKFEYPDKILIKEGAVISNEPIKTQVSTTPNAGAVLTKEGIILSSQDNTTHGDDIIPADEQVAEYQVEPFNRGMSLLPDDVAVPNAQIAAFDSNEDTQTQDNEKGSVLTKEGIILSNTTAAEDIKLSPEGYVIYQDAEEIENTKTNEDDMGMER